MLRELLQVPSLDFLERAQVEKALRYPWCWPQTAELLDHEAVKWLPSPAGLAPGEALLVSATPGDGGYRLGLWKLWRRPSVEAPSRTEAHFVNESRRTLRVAEQIVTRGLPFILSMEPLQVPGDWYAELIYKTGTRRDEALDGTSYGLSFLLASASLLLQVALPPDLVASATLAEDGSLGAVEALPEKISLLVGSGLGVGRLMVAASQEESARAAVAACNGSVQVLGVRTAREAFAQVFNDAHQRLVQQWSHPDDIKRAARRLYLMALGSGSPILDWKAVARGADFLLSQLAEGEPAFDEATVAGKIAKRHTGEPSPMPWPTDAFLQRLSRPLRQVHMAHVLQSANDAGTSALMEIVSSIQKELPSARECYEPQLVLRGAVGRALAALRHYEEASPYLRETVEAWRELGRIQDASYPLCELLRVIGILRDADALSSLESLLREFRASPLLSPDSRGFLRLALGRAHTLLGQPQEALLVLGAAGDVAWGAMRDDIQNSRLRWLAWAQSAAGQLEEAVRTRQRLPEDRFEALLACLDRVLEQGEDPEPVLGQLLAHREIHPASRLLEGVTAPQSRAEILAREYPY